jgi:dCTP deaminase
MAFWSSQTLEKKIADLVDPSDPALIDCNAVTLRVGREIYITPGLEQPAPNSHTKRILKDDKEPFAIPPGQFAFVLTEETVKIPPEAMGFISMRATFKLKGLVNVSGFHVDPGWNGPLIFAVFNAGPAAVHLQRGLPVFLLWIADLDEASNKRKSAPGGEGIPPMMINNITGVVDSLYALDKRLKEEMKKLSDKDIELGDRIHQIDKLQNRVLLGIGIGGGILLTLIGVATRAAWLSFFP